MKKGDWVKVWGQVTDTKTHPEDVEVEFFSHNEQFHAPIRKDRIEEALLLPGFAEECYALREYDAEVLGEMTKIHLKCTGHLGHDGKHRCGRVTWKNAQNVGWIEEA